MKKQFLLLTLLATTATIRPDNSSYKEIIQTKKNSLEENIYKASFLLGIASIASAISKGDSNLTRGLSYVAASGFFIAPLGNAYKSQKISNQAMLAFSGLITGAAFINTPNDFEHEEKRQLLGSMTTTLAGLCNIRSRRKLIYNALFGAVSCIGSYKTYTAADKILHPEPHKFEPFEELEELPFSDTILSDFSSPLEELPN